jgi:succinate dehydrogenase / fumarate reductase cytochrome b subunit
MAVTGLLLIGFLIAHMSANLLVIFDAEAYNEYSHTLISNPLIYAAEFGLLALFVGHLVSGIAVTLRNRRARPVPYALKNPAGHTSRKTLASSTMIFSGVVMLVFVPLHILTFKFGAWYDSVDHPGVRDLHRLVLEEFQRPGFVVWYLVALTVLGAHAWHGFGSAFESIGVSQRSWIRAIGKALTAVLWAGFCAVPIYVYFFVGGAS